MVFSVQQFTAQETCHLQYNIFVVHMMELFWPSNQITTIFVLNYAFYFISTSTTKMSTRKLDAHTIYAIQCRWSIKPRLTNVAPHEEHSLRFTVTDLLLHTTESHQ